MRYYRDARALNAHPFIHTMFRWLIVIFVALLVINAFTPWFKRIGFGRLPGDLSFTLFGREFNLPLTTTIILSMVAAGVSRLL